MRYLIEYVDKAGFLQSESLVAVDPGSAFAKCQKKYPGATMKKAKCYGRTQGGEGWATFDPPRVQRDPLPEPRVPRPLKPDDRSCVFDFYDHDQVVKERPNPF